MYSARWFETFAETMPASATEAEVSAIAAIVPQAMFPRLLEIGCGTGRVAGPLAARGYDVTGIDASLPALRTARMQAAGVRLVALDQRHVGEMRWRFDAALVVWNSFGFDTREADLETLTGLARVLRPGGKLLLDLYHPAWLEQNARTGERDARGASIDRWVRDGRLFHTIHYADGTAPDDIQFNVYTPEEIAGAVTRAGLHPDRAMAWWDPARPPGPEHARFQIICTR